MLAIITEAVLDITFGTVWWMGKKTVSGIGYLISYPSHDSVSASVPIADFQTMLDTKNSEIHKLKGEIKKLKQD